MSEILFQYQKIGPTMWAQLSSLLIIGLYFKFNRFWSVRNLDLCLIILLAPGLLMVFYGDMLSRDQTKAVASVPDGQATPTTEDATNAPAEDAGAVPKNDEQSEPEIGPETEPAGENSASADTENSVAPIEPAKAAAATSGPGSGSPITHAARSVRKAELDYRLPNLSPERARGVMHFGYIWLLAVSLILCIRLLCDPTMVRRPLLEPNLSNGGLLFIGCALLIFLMANVLASEVSDADINGSQGAQALLEGQDTGNVEIWHRFGPGYYLLNLLPKIPTLPFGQLSQNDPRIAFATAARTMAIISHLSVVTALVIIGLWHFDNIKLGIGAAALYLMLPYTAQMTGHVNHVLPSALMLWAVVFYRRPALAGIFIGLSVGVVYYPIFLLPLWISFYWQRGVLRYLMGLVGAIAVMAVSLAFVSEDITSFGDKIRQMFGLFMPNMDSNNLQGIWSADFGWDPIWRLPCIAASICLSASFAIWPAQKNLGTLLSCSAAMMLAVQFWHGYGGGTYIAWFMPLMLLTIFRPNLEDRIALTVLGEGWLSKRRARLAPLGRAA
jgi:hypothetical protein